MVDLRGRGGLISCLCHLKGNSRHPALAAFPGKLPDKIFIASHAASSAPTCSKEQQI